MKNSLKIITLSATFMLLGTVVSPVIATVSAETTNHNSNVSSSFVAHSIDKQKSYLINNYGLTKSELHNNDDITYLYKVSNSRTRVGASAIAKAVLKIWKKLPKGIKSKIAKYTGIAGFLKAIDHFTGTEYHIIYSACRYVGMPRNVADIVTKTITLFI